MKSDTDIFKERETRMYAAEICRIEIALQNINQLDGRNLPGLVALDIGTAMEALKRANKKLRLASNALGVPAKVLLQ